MSTMLPAAPEVEFLAATPEPGGTLGRVAHAAGIGIGLLGFCGRITEYNRPLEMLTGCTGNELRGKSLVSLCAPEHRNECHDLLQELCLGFSDGFDLEVRLVSRDGRRVWAHLTGNVIPESQDIVFTMHDSSDYAELLEE